MKIEYIFNRLSKIMLSGLEKLRQLHRPNLLIIIFIFVILAGSAVAQSTDPDKPTPMTTNEVKGRWPGGKATAYYYSFEAGPGEVFVMFDFLPDHDLLNVVAELTDKYGRGIINLDSSQGSSELSYFATTKGLRLVGRYQIKRRQTFVAKIAFTGDGDEVVPGAYKIRVEGGNPSFLQPGTSTNQTGNNPNAEKDLSGCLPKSGILRLVLNDGTVQEINLNRVREASIKQP